MSPLAKVSQSSGAHFGKLDGDLADRKGNRHLESGLLTIACWVRYLNLKKEKAEVRWCTYAISRSNHFEPRLEGFMREKVHVKVRKRYAIEC